MSKQSNKIWNSSSALSFFVVCSHCMFGLFLSHRWRERVRKEDQIVAKQVCVSIKWCLCDLCLLVNYSCLFQSEPIPPQWKHDLGRARLIDDNPYNPLTILHNLNIYLLLFQQYQLSPTDWTLEWQDLGWLPRLSNVMMSTMTA
jgi:hypothetical protein